MAVSFVNHVGMPWSLKLLRDKGHPEIAEVIRPMTDARAEGDGRLVARLAYFTTPEDVPGAKPVAATSTRDFPAVDLVAESFTFRGRMLMPRDCPSRLERTGP